MTGTRQSVHARLARRVLHVALCFVLALSMARTAPARCVQAAPDQGAIDASIERGLRWLLSAQNRDGSWSDESTDKDTVFDLRNAQTAFSVWTLAKCGLPPEHPSIVRALAYLERDKPWSVYSISAQILMYDALGSPEKRLRFEPLVRALLALKTGDGFGYGTERQTIDLSNMQYAALALRAADRAGLPLSKQLWLDLLAQTQRHQEKVKAFTPAVVTGKAIRKDAAEKAGFTYRAAEGSASASMTVAGLTVLCVVDERMQGRVSPKDSSELSRARALGLAALEDGFTLRENAGGDSAWHYYYVYGVERVGAMLAQASFGGHDWYREGVELLLKLQGADGSWRVEGESIWAPRPMSRANTCFALLFLTRATQTATGPGSRPAARRDLVFKDEPLEDWMLEYAGGRENLLDESTLDKVKASSELDTYCEAWRIADGLQFRGWVAKADDLAPRIELTLEKPVRVKHIALAQMNASRQMRGEFALVKRVRLRWNDDRAGQELTLDPEPLKKSVLTLPRPVSISRIELTLLEWEPGTRGAAAGLAELELWAP